MKTVHLVFENDWEGSHVVGVFENTEDAEEYIAKVSPRVRGWDFPPSFSVEGRQIGWFQSPDFWPVREKEKT